MAIIAILIPFVLACFLLAAILHGVRCLFGKDVTRVLNVILLCVGWYIFVRWGLINAQEGRPWSEVEPLTIYIISIFSTIVYWGFWLLWFMLVYPFLAVLGIWHDMKHEKQEAV